MADLAKKHQKTGGAGGIDAATYLTPLEQRIAGLMGQQTYEGNYQCVTTVIGSVGLGKFHPSIFGFPASHLICLLVLNNLMVDLSRSDYYKAR